jgi:hypothetical protein
MKYFLIFALSVLLFCFLFQQFYHGSPSEQFIASVTKQDNPFSVPKDSAAIIWHRASEYLDKNKLTIVGGNLQIEDSVLNMPYYNDFHKGNSLRIQMNTRNDSVIFKVNSWYSGKVNSFGAKKIAYFMQSGKYR